MNNFSEISDSVGQAIDTSYSAQRDMQKRFERKRLDPNYVLTMEQAVNTIKVLLDSINFDSGIDRLNFARFLVSGIIAHDNIASGSRIAPPLMMVIESRRPECGKTALAAFFRDLFHGIITHNFNAEWISTAVKNLHPVVMIDNPETLDRSGFAGVGLAVTAGTVALHKQDGNFVMPMVIATSGYGALGYDLLRRCIRVELVKTDEIKDICFDDLGTVRNALRKLTNHYSPDSDTFSNVHLWTEKMDEFLKPVFRLS